MSKRVALGAVALLGAAVVLCPSPGQAGDKQPKPSSVLKTAAKNLARGRSYRVSLSVEGGIASDASHKITQPSYRGSWQGNVIRGVMHLPSNNAYRTPKDGTMFDSNKGVWVSILSIPEGAEMHRLFDYPELVLAEAARYAKNAKNAEWVAPSKSADGGATAPTAAAAAPADGKTTTTGPDQGGASGADDATPSKIRVFAPAQEAVRRFNVVQSSGCVSGG